MPPTCNENGKKSTCSKKGSQKVHFFPKCMQKSPLSLRKHAKRSTFAGKAPPQIQTWLQACVYCILTGHVSHPPRLICPNRSLTCRNLLMELQKLFHTFLIGFRLMDCIPVTTFKQFFFQLKDRLCLFFAEDTLPYWSKLRLYFFLSEFPLFLTQSSNHVLK